MEIAEPGPRLAAVAGVTAELARCCQRLADLFPADLPAASLLNGALPRIRVEPDGRRYPLHDRSQELVLSEEDLQQPRPQLVRMLLHGLIHCANARAGVRDCSPTHYHNRHFRDLALRVGLRVEHCQPRFGWADGEPGEALSRALAAAAGELPVLPAPGLAAVAMPVTWRCGENLSRGLRSAYWRQPELPLPPVPRYRIALVHEAAEPYDRYACIRRMPDAAALLWQILRSYDREALAALFLDNRRRLIGYDVPYVGTLSRACVEPRAILATALMVNAAALIIGHNHPSGDPSPSHDDIVFTRRLAKAGEVMGIELVSSLVIGGPGRWRAVR